MKRTRAEPSTTPSSSFPSKLSPPPQKTQKRSSPKDPTNPKPTSARARKANANGGAPTVKKEQEEYPMEPKEREKEEEEMGLGFADGGEGFGLWCGSVEEEVLLGWFPFVEEHFPWSGLGWQEEEEEEGEYCDIWQLQHIHEIPNTPK